jgi:hypothetical protein
MKLHRVKTGNRSTRSAIAIPGAGSKKLREQELVMNQTRIDANTVIQEGRTVRRPLEVVEQTPVAAVEAAPKIRIMPRLVNPTAPLPTYETMPAPKLTVVDTSALKNTKVWAVVESDLDELLRWCGPAIQEWYPGFEVVSLGHWLRAAIYDNSIRLVRTENVLAALEVSRTPWYPEGVATLRFIVNRGKRAEDAVEVLETLIAWAKGARVHEFHVAWDKASPTASGKLLGAKHAKAYDIIYLTE